jgi:hypothetical protein
MMRLAILPRTSILVCALLTAAGCAGNKPAGETLTPAPLLTERALAGCAYEPIASVEEERTTPVVNLQKEMERALGIKARWINADAIIQMKIAEIGPVMRGGPASTSANGRRASGARATALAIRITSACPAKSGR